MSKVNLTTGESFPLNPNNGDIHELIFLKIDDNPVKPKFHRFSSIKQKWIYLGDKEYMETQFELATKDVLCNVRLQNFDYFDIDIYDLLKEANVNRLPKFKNGQGIAYHKENGSDWNISKWLTAVIGELGEYANLEKKLFRGDIPTDKLDEVKLKIAHELADIAIYLSILDYRYMQETMDDSQYPYFSNHKNRYPGVRYFNSNEDNILQITKLLAILSADENNNYKEISNIICAIYEMLRHCAENHGLDLYLCIMNKFNLTSKKLDIDVYFSKDGKSVISDYKDAY